MKKILTLCLLLALPVLSSCVPPHEDDWALHWFATQIQDSSEPLVLTPGVFTGIDSGGLQGDVSVAVTIDNAGVITSIDIVYSNETPRFADPAFEYLIPSVLSSQSADVDAYSSATWTSRAFLNAVWDALAQSAADD